MIASLVIAGVPAFAQTPVPVQEPKPRPVPIAPDAPPPNNDEKKPYPVPVPVDPAPAPTPPPAATPDKPAAPPADKPAAPTPPAAQKPAPPAAQKPAPPAVPLSPPGAAQPGAPPVTGPGTIPPGPIAPAPIAAPAPVTVTPPPVTTTKVHSYPQTPLVGSAKIKKIVVDGNSKTDTDTVILISKLDVGDDWTADMKGGVENELVSCGLFKEVTVYWSNVEGGVQIHLLVKDKHSWVIAPAFYTQPTNVGGGIGFGENNLFGQNQKLLLYGQIATGDTFFIGAWVIPSLGGTRFYAQLDTFLKSSRNIEYAAPDGYIDGADAKAVRESRMHYLNGGVKLGIELFRGFKIDARLRAAKVSFQEVKLADGATLADVDPTLTEGAPIPAPGGEGWDVTNEWTASIDRRANYYGIQSGYRLAVSYERAIEGASDFKYTLTGAYLYRAWKILERHNFVWKTAVNYGRDVPFQQEYTIGGPAMRGYINSQFRGDFKALANLEYSVPLMSIKGFSVRGQAFIDSGYATFLRTRPMEAQRHYLPGSEARGGGPFKNSVGIGTRLYLRQIVLPLLGLDFGYGLEARDYQIYLAVGLTD